MNQIYLTIMKKIGYIASIFFLLLSCTSQENSKDFIKKTQGRYLFNANEVIEIYFKDKILHAKWRGSDDIELLKINDSTFYMKSLNEKMIFISKPATHIRLAKKKEHKGITYHFRKMKDEEKTAMEYFNNKEFDKSLKTFVALQKIDSLNPTIQQRRLNRLGYSYIRNHDYDNALQIFKINTVLYPKSSNTFNSLGEVYYLKKDTINAIVNLKKALSINPENRNAKRFLTKINQK